MPSRTSTQEREAEVKIGRAIRACRRVKGLTQVELASACGVTFQSLQKYEVGSTRIAASRLLTVAKALKVPVADLYASAEGC